MIGCNFNTTEECRQFILFLINIGYTNNLSPNPPYELRHIRLYPLQHSILSSKSNPYLITDYNIIKVFNIGLVS